MTEMKWIDVNEFLPGKLIVWVIVRVKNIDDAIFWTIANFNNEKTEWEFLFLNEKKIKEEEFTITHWMLPINPITNEYEDKDKDILE